MSTQDADAESGPASRPSAVKYFGIAAPLGVGVIGALVIAGLFLRPAAPETVVMTTGFSGGAYHAFALKYKEILAKEFGVELRLVTSDGAAANLEALDDPRGSKVQIGFVQGGIVFQGNPNDHRVRKVAQEKHPDLRSLGSMFYEPLWIFYSVPAGAPKPGAEPGKWTPQRLSDLKGKRIAIGGKGTGTQVLLRQLLPVAGLKLEEATLVEKGGMDAVKALRGGEVDVAIFSVAEDSPFVEELSKPAEVRDGEPPGPEIQLMDLVNAEAFTRRFAWLANVTLPRGAIHIERDWPKEDLRLIAPTASLVVRKDLHPAIVQMLLQAATRVHGEAGPFQKLNEFPSIQHQELPLLENARQYIAEGPSRLYRYLPFWLATLLLRIGFILPIAAVIFSIVRLTPSVYDWWVRARIYRWYGELRYIEDDLVRSGPSADLERFDRRIGRVEQRVARLVTPIVYSDRLYTLRGHISYVRAKLKERRGIDLESEGEATDEGADGQAGSPEPA